MPTEILREGCGDVPLDEGAVLIEYGFRVTGYGHKDANSALDPDETEIEIQEISIFGRRASEQLRRAILAEFGDKMREAVLGEVESH